MPKRLCSICEGGYGKKRRINNNQLSFLLQEIPMSKPNVCLSAFTICRFSQAIINFRMGIRRNNSQLVKSAKFHLKELFYARTHPHYQHIDIFDTIQYHFMSDEVNKVWDENISFTVSGDPPKGQDMDFLLEEKNKSVKHYIPSGTIPSDEMWKNICCNLKYFENLQDKLSDLLD